MKKVIIILLTLIIILPSMYGQSNKMDLSKKVVKLSKAKDTTQKLMSFTIELKDVPKELWIDVSTLSGVTGDDGSTIGAVTVESPISITYNIEVLKKQIRWK